MIVVAVEVLEVEIQRGGRGRDGWGMHQRSRRGKVEGRTAYSSSASMTGILGCFELDSLIEAVAFVFGSPSHTNCITSFSNLACLPALLLPSSLPFPFPFVIAVVFNVDIDRTEIIAAEVLQLHSADQV